MLGRGAGGCIERDAVGERVSVSVHLDIVYRGKNICFGVVAVIVGVVLYRIVSSSYLSRAVEYRSRRAV